MTVNSTVSKIQFEGNGTTQNAYSWTFEIFSKDDIEVFRSSQPDTPLVDGVDYTVTLIKGTPGGSLTTSVAIPDTETLTILRKAAPTQPRDFPRGGDLDTREIENGLDLATMLIQQQDETLSRVPTLPKATGTDVSVELPPPVANTIVAMWDEKAKKLVVGPEASSVAQMQAIAHNALVKLNDKITISTDFPPDGSDGDIWFKVST